MNAEAAKAYAEANKVKGVDTKKQRKTLKKAMQESMKSLQKYLQLSNNITLTRPMKNCSKHPEN